MSPELSQFLVIIGVGAVVGALVGIYIRTRRPRAAERYANWSAQLPWWVFLLFAAFFVLMASIPQGRPYFTWFGLGFAALEAAYAVYRLAQSRGGEGA